MSSSGDHERRFAAYLESLVAGEDRAALAALRRGLGKEPGTAAEMYPHVVPWLPHGARPWEENAFYLVAALFADHQIPWPRSDDRPEATNLGASFARLAAQTASASVEKRFVALLECHRDDLPTHLRHAISLLKSKDVPVDWPRLLRDIRGWDREDRRVQRDWARAFWGHRPSETQPRDPSTPPAPTT